MKKKLKETESSMDWRRVEELLAEKLADRVKINLRIRESESEEDDDTSDEGDYSQEDIDEEINSRDSFFAHRSFTKTNRVA